MTDKSEKLPRLLTLKQAAEYAGMSVWTIRDMIGSGLIPVVRFGNIRRLFIDRDDLDELIEKSKERMK